METRGRPGDPAPEQSSQDGANIRPATGRLNRRTFLTVATAAATVGATGAWASTLSPAFAVPSDRAAVAGFDREIWSVAMVGDAYVALTGVVGESMAVHELIVDGEGRARLGAFRPIDFPEGFTPTTINGIGERLLVAGGMTVEVGRLQIDNRSDAIPAAYRDMMPPDDLPNAVFEVVETTQRPAVLEVVGRRTRELDLGEAAKLAWGVATAIASTDDTLVVAIEGSNDRLAAYANIVQLAESGDGGSTWSMSVLAHGQGEGFPTSLAATADTVVAITVDGNERRTVHQRGATAKSAWSSSSVPIEVTSGPVEALVVDRSGSLDVYDGGEHHDHGGHHHFRKSRLRLSDGSWTAAQPVLVGGSEVHRVLPVHGFSSRWLAIGDGIATIIG